MSNFNVDASYVVEHMDSVPVIDLRPAHMYGVSHIPHAQNVDFWTMKSEYSEDFPAKLVEALGELGVQKHDEVISYCQIGMTSSAATALLAERGYTEVRHYVDGWEDWVSDYLRPTEER